MIRRIHLKISQNETTIHHFSDIRLTLLRSTGKETAEIHGIDSRTGSQQSHAHRITKIGW